MQLVEQNLRETFEWLARRRPGGEVGLTAGVSFASAAVRFQMFNAAFLAPGEPAGDAELARRIATASVHFGARGLDWAFWVCDHLLARTTRWNAPGIFERNRLQAAATLPAMLADRLLPPRGPLPPLDVRGVDGTGTRQAFCDVGSTCFRVPPAWFEEIFDPEAVWADPMEGYVGYAAGEPVATVMTYITGDTAGIYNVATLPGYRRRGYAESILRHALGQVRARHGIERSILQSTDAGFALYERMGYRTVGRVSVYSSGMR